jgi:hypothetical protein
MSTQKCILYTSLKASAGISPLVAGISHVHASPNGISGGGVTIKNTLGISTGDISTFLGTTITANSLDSMYVCIPSATSTATNVITYDQLASLDSRMKTAVRGSVHNKIVTGTCGTNTGGATSVILTGGSAVDDTYIGKYLMTSLSGTDRYFYITAYTGSTTEATIVNASTAITDTSTFTVFTQPNLYVLGDAVSNETAARYAFRTLFPDAVIPPIVGFMGGYGSGFQPHYKYDETATSAAATSLTHTSEFTLSEFDGGTWYVAIESGTTGAGEIKRIISNTADILTVEPWEVLPTGTIKYQIQSGSEFALYDQFLKYAIMTYLGNLSLSSTQQAYQQLIDKLNVLPAGELTPTYNATLLKNYADIGKAIQQSVNMGMTTA